MNQLNALNIHVKNVLLINMVHALNAEKDFNLKKELVLALIINVLFVWQRIMWALVNYAKKDI